jgi:hypothetical protein
MVGLAMIAGCGSGAGGPGSASPVPAGSAALGYSIPVVNPVTYETGDSAIISMNMSGMAVDVTIEFAGTAEIAYAQAGENLAATVRYLTASGRFANSMGPETVISSGDLPGPAQLTIEPNGRYTLTSTPDMSTALKQVLGSNGAYRRLFINLPGRVVTRGTQWTDTIVTTDEADGLRTSVREIITSTFSGDTTIAGHRLHVIRSTSVTATDVSGNAQGFEMSQKLSGTSTAIALWDPERRLLVERSESGGQSGSMEMPAAGMSGVPVSVSSIQVMRLKSP